MQIENVDYRAELEEFEWHRPRWSEDKLIAASPFRYDQHPSFFVSMEHGGWRDSGAIDTEWQSGSFERLLSFLRHETVEETVDYLLYKYAPIKPDGSMVLLPPRLPKKKAHQQAHAVSVGALAGMTPGSPYLLERGITADVQALYGVQHSGNKTAIPWRKPDGQLANVKFRLHGTKTFWYVKGAHPVRKLVWGVDVVNAAQADEIIVCEAEIDAMSWACVGKTAVATGSASLSKEQAEIIRRSSARSIVLGGDNDAAGRSFNEAVKAALGPYYTYQTVNYGEFKDANAALTCDILDDVRFVEFTGGESFRLRL